MTKKLWLSLFVVVGLLALTVPALAQGPGYGRGPGYGWGGGPCWWGADQEADQETIKLRSGLYQKGLEMRALLAAPNVDEAKAQALQAEINQLRGELSNKRLSAMLEFKKKNPDWQPGAGFGYGPGWRHRGGWGPGPGGGPGACWR